MNGKEISVVFYGRNFSRSDWTYPINMKKTDEFLRTLAAELAPLGIRLAWREETSHTLEVKGYGDLLNCVRILSPQDNIGNLCLGHIIGASANRDLLEDIRRGVTRVAFAPEMVEPEEGNKKVCHNCGCGC